MGHIEATRTLNATPEKIYEVATDFKNWGEWFSIHERWMEEPPAQAQVGTKLVAKIVMLGMANKMEWTIDEIGDREFAMSGAGMAGVKVHFRFLLEPAEGDRCSVTVSGDFEGALIKGALGKAVEKDGTKQLDKSLDGLERVAGNKE